MNSFWVQTLQQAVISGTPLAIAGLGELVAETAGVINLGVEGTMLMGAVAGYAAAIATQNVWLGLACGLATGGLFGLLHALFTISLRINQIAVGLTLVFLGTGLSGYAGRSIAGTPVFQSFQTIALPGLSSIPILGPILFTHDLVVYGTVLLAFVLWALLRFSVLGLNLRAAGEDPAATDSAGVPITFVRYGAVIFGAGMAGLAGSYFALAVAHAWAEQITGGQGWIAIALVIAASWCPIRLLAFAFVFGMIDSLDYSLQASGTMVPAALLQMLPYVFTLLIMAAGVVWRSSAGSMGPAGLGRPYSREERT